MIKVPKIRSTFLTFVACAVLSSVCCAKPRVDTATALTIDCSEFQKLIERTYNFKPTKLTEAQQTEKSSEMDAVWNQVKTNSQTLAPCLKASLLRPDANSFFLFDGSTLLSEIDDSREAKELLIRSYSKADLEDIVLSNWIAPILKLGLDGIDTSAAGEAWLNAKDPKYYLPQHGDLPVDRSIGALAIFGSMDETFATPALAKLARSADVKTREIAVRILLDQATPESVGQAKLLDAKQFSSEVGDRLKKLSVKPNAIVPRSGKPLVTRDEFTDAFNKMAKGDARTFVELTEKVTDGERDAIVVLTKDDLPLVRKARRFMASTGTPHIPEWYKSFTDIIQAVSWEAQPQK